MLIQKSICPDSIVAHFPPNLLLADFCNKICHERSLQSKNHLSEEPAVDPSLA
jgi:hypothetical protein